MIKAFKKYKNEDATYFLFLLAVVLLLKLPTLTVDYHWDALEYAAQAKYYSIYGLLTIPSGPIVHVPVLQWSLAVLYNIFGESPALSNLVIAIFSFVGAYFTYLLGKHLYGKKVGIIASLLLFFSPTYFAISGQVLFDIPLAAMTVVALYYGIKRNFPLYLVSASILVLTKEPGFLVILVFVVNEMLKRKVNFKIKIKNVIAYSIPIVFLLLWWVWIWTQTGYFLNRPDLKFPEMTPIFFIQKLSLIFYTSFIWNYKWILTIFIFLIILKLKTKFITKENLPLILTLIFYALLFSIQILLPRYLLPIYPIFFIFASYSLVTLTKKWNYLIVLLMIIFFVSCYRFNWDVKGIVQDPAFHSRDLASLESGELSLDYLDMVETEKDALQYIFLNHPNSTIVTYFPFAYKTSSIVDMGYRQWSKYDISVLMPNKENIEKADLIVYEPYSSWVQKQIDLLPRTDPIKIFEKNGKRVLIYQSIKGA